MKVAILGDIHGDVEYLNMALDIARSVGAEMMIQLGDFGFDYKDSFLTGISQSSDTYEIPILVVRGNHDDPGRFTSYAKVRNVHFIPDGFVTTIGKKVVAFLGGAVSIDRAARKENISWWRNERVNPHIVNAWSIDDVKADVLISHEAPLMPDNLPNLFSLSSSVTRDCDEDRNIVRTAAEILEPDVIYHGHYHFRHTKTLFMGDGRKALVEGLDCNHADLNDSLIIREF